MVITLRCPQGHTVLCPDDKVGQAGKCPKCGSKFTVQPSLALSGGGASQDVIVFLCPNGHKLNGPASLQGRPGQCPHCHAKFVIPDYNEPDDQEADEVATDESQLPFDTAPNAVSEDRAEVEPEPVEPQLDGFSMAEMESGYVEEIAGEYDPAAADELAIGSHPMAAIVNHFWQERRDGAVVEVQLKDGSVLIPEHYAEAHSQQDHGVFGVKDADGSYTLSAVAWDAVARVSLRRLHRLPRELFD